MESNYQRTLVSSFLNIAVDQTVETAIKCLKSTNWKLEDAINLLFAIDRMRNNQTLTLKPSDSTRLPSLSPPPPPLNLLFKGSFEDAKLASSSKDRWLLVHIQSETEFPCNTFNRDLWSNEDVSQALEFRGEIKAKGFLNDLKKYIDASPHEHIASTARNMRVKAEKICHSDQQDMGNLSSDSVVVSSCGREFDDVVTLSEDEEETCLSSDLFEFPVLTKEPKGDCDRSVVCSISVRFPNGRRKQRKFLKSEPVQLLWSFCYSHMDESDNKAFKLVQAIPGASKTLDYGAEASFDQYGISNSIISVTWE
ncbi:putative plant UBX domain-containing protein 15 [Arabidopsis thaliana]|uniref:UBX domain n=1 Tax=Arabidopsis thaliana x Arabidopsis arenosa TaxID=1240361 RepID=A0A8T2GRS3_9BRAS|nr:UBX domain [Arabidopsis thaliana x Arabidopsis arenosa]